LAPHGCKRLCQYRLKPGTTIAHFDTLHNQKQQIMKHNNPLSATARLLAFVSLVLLPSVGILAQAGFLQLRHGVLINKERNEVYITTPQQRVQALNLVPGQALWTSSMEAMPLALANNKLVCMATAATQGNTLSIVELDLSQRGARSGGYLTALPSNVNIGNLPNTGNLFDIVPRFAQDNIYLIWHYRSIPTKGIYEEDTARAGNLPMQDSGVFRVDKVGGRLRTMAAVPALPQGNSIMGNRINAKDRFGQYRSADGLHTLVSTKTANDLTFENYRWEVSETATGRKLGEFTDYRAYAPFYVSGNTIIYEKGPYAVAENNGVREVPLQLVAVDLTNGRTLWTKDIFDNVYRGSLPPAKTN
jgi:hypothetical protein